jgi:hypothetical protein
MSERELPFAADCCPCVGKLQTVLGVCTPAQPPPRGEDATELAHADMTALPKTDTNYTALSLIPITGNTFAASLRTDICPQRKESSSTSHARNPFNLNFFLIRLSV